MDERLIYRGTTWNHLVSDWSVAGSRFGLATLESHHKASEVGTEIVSKEGRQTGERSALRGSKRHPRSLPTKPLSPAAEMKGAIVLGAAGVHLLVIRRVPHGALLPFLIPVSTAVQQGRVPFHAGAPLSSVLVPF